MNIKTNITNYDPDELVLSKQDIMDVLKTIRSIWVNGGIIKNARYIGAIELFTQGIRLVGDKEIKAIFAWTVRFIDLLRYANFKAKKGKENAASEFLKKTSQSWLDNPEALSKEIFG